MAIEKLTDRRKEHADALREIATLVETSPQQLTGLTFQIFWNDHTVTEGVRIAPGYNQLAAAGLFLKLANECVHNSSARQLNPVGG